MPPPITVSKAPPLPQQTTQLLGSTVRDFGQPQPCTLLPCLSGLTPSLTRQTVLQRLLSAGIAEGAGNKTGKDSALGSSVNKPVACCQAEPTPLKKNELD